MSSTNLYLLTKHKACHSFVNERRPKKRTISIVVLLAFVSLFVYKPLPEGLAFGLHDRFAMHIIEPVLRITYLYPADR